MMAPDGPLHNFPGRQDQGLPSKEEATDQAKKALCVEALLQLPEPAVRQIFFLLNADDCFVFDVSMHRAAAPVIDFLFGDGRGTNTLAAVMSLARTLGDTRITRRFTEVLSTEQLNALPVESYVLRNPEIVSTYFYLRTMTIPEIKKTWSVLFNNNPPGFSVGSPTELFLYIVEPLCHENSERAQKSKNALWQAMSAVAYEEVRFIQTHIPNAEREDLAGTIREMLFSIEQYHNQTDVNTVVANYLNFDFDRLVVTEDNDPSKYKAMVNYAIRKNKVTELVNGLSYGILGKLNPNTMPTLNKVNNLARSL